MKRNTQDNETLAVALASTTAARFCRHGQREVGYDDLFGAALLGAAKALHRYDPARGVAFRTFAIRLIRCEIQEELRQWDHLTRDGRKRARALYEATGEYPTWAQAPASFEDVVSEIEPDVAPLYRGEQFAAPDDTEAEALTNIERERWQDLLDGLPEPERYVARRYFWDGRNSAEIAQEIGRSEARSGQLRQSALARIAVWAEEEGLIP